MLDELEYRVDSHVAYLVLDNQRANNSLNPTMLAGIERLLLEARADGDVRALVLSARGPIFCNGMDFQLMSGGAGEGADKGEGADNEAGTSESAAHNTSAGISQAARQFARFLTLIRDFPKPVFAVVSGQVRAGGMGLVAAADVVLATEGARFELSELIFGLLPAVVLPFLLERISLKHARYLCLTARNLSASEALGIGLVDQVAADEKSLTRSCNALLRQVLRVNPDAIHKLKQYTDQLAEMPRFGQRVHLARELLVSLLGDRDTQRVIRAFTEEGMAPPWFASHRPTTREL